VEGDLRALARESDGLVNSARRFSGYTRRHRFTRAKDFLMYAVGGDAPGNKTSAHIMTYLAKQIATSSGIEHSSLPLPKYLS